MSQLPADMLKYFSALIEKETGIQYQETNGHLLANRLSDLAKFMNLPDIQALWLQIKAEGLSADAKAVILDLATNNETSFFRDLEVFDFFRDQFVKKSGSTRPLRIWCAATSTGQEPYSLALVMAQLRENGINKDYEIVCTDISDRVLKQAASGTFSQLEVGRGLPLELRNKYFDQQTVANSNMLVFKAKPEISRFMTFRKLNLLDAWPNLGTFDIVFCRNVLIYQNIENKKKVIARIASILSPEGYLVLGGAESLLGLSNDFAMEQHGKACVYKRKSTLKLTA